MAYIETKKPRPNMNKEYVYDVTPCADGRITLYDLSRYLEPYNGRDRDKMMFRITHEIHGATCSFYIIDDYKILTRKQAIKLADRIINGDFDTYRLD